MKPFYTLTVALCLLCCITYAQSFKITIDASTGFPARLAPTGDNAGKQAIPNNTTEIEIEITNILTPDVYEFHIEDLAGGTQKLTTKADGSCTITTTGTKTTLKYKVDKFFDNAWSKNKRSIEIKKASPLATIYKAVFDKPNYVDGSKVTKTDDDDKTFEPFIGALTSANFIGNNKFLSNLTPIVNMGVTSTIVSRDDDREDGKKNNDAFKYSIETNPYFGGEIDTKDSSSFIPALMLQGRGGLVLNNHLNFLIGKSDEKDKNYFKVNIMPFGFGLKFMPNLQDSTKTVLQHNIRAGISLQYSNVFVLGTQLTHGWHNLTSESKKNFTSIFGNEVTDISYITVVGQFALKGKADAITNYIYFEWRKLLSEGRYSGFTNNGILTMGIRKTLEIGSGSTFSANKRSKRGRKIHPMSF